MLVKTLLTSALVPVVVDLLTRGVKDIGNATIDKVVERVRSRLEKKAQITQEELTKTVEEELEINLAPLTLQQVEELAVIKPSLVSKIKAKGRKCSFSSKIKKISNLEIEIMRKRHLITLIRIRDSLDVESPILQEAIEALEAEMAG